MTCRYCTNFQHGKLRRVRDDTGKGETHRLCNGRRVSADRKICDDFAIADFFYCYTLSQYVHFSACVARRRHDKMKECVRCKDFEKDVAPLRRYYWAKTERIEAIGMIRTKKPGEVRQEDLIKRTK